MRGAAAVAGALVACAALAGCGGDGHEWRRNAEDVREQALEADSTAAQLALIDQSIERGSPLTYAEVEKLWGNYEACLLERDIVIEGVEFSSEHPGVRVRAKHLTYVPLGPPITGEEIEECRSRTHAFAEALVREDD